MSHFCTLNFMDWWFLYYYRQDWIILLLYKILIIIFFCFFWYNLKFNHSCKLTRISLLSYYVTKNFKTERYFMSNCVPVIILVWPDCSNFWVCCFLLLLSEEYHAASYYIAILLPAVMVYILEFLKIAFNLYFYTQHFY